MILLFHALVSWYLLGMIWTIQLVHYPSFLSIDGAYFSKFHRFHQRQMFYLVGPAMILELLTGAWLLWQKPGSVFVLLFFVVRLLWGFTFFVSVPIHEKLVKNGFDRKCVEKLISTNWPRTCLWTIKSTLLFTFIVLRGHL